MQPNNWEPSTLAEAAWLAGFFDGEGSLGAYKSHGCRSWRLSLKNTHWGSLFKCKKITGAGHINPNPKDKPHHSLKWIWQVNKHRDIIEICRQILPFLIIKKDRVETFLEAVRRSVPGEQTIIHRQRAGGFA